MEERIIELETKLAYQEDTIQSLNQVITTLQSEIVLIHQRQKQFQEQLQQALPSNIANASEETPPPHY